MYYDIFTTNTHAEYHVSQNREDIQNRASMSRRIAFDKATPEQVANAMLGWFRDADFYRCERVESSEYKAA